MTGKPLNAVEFRYTSRGGEDVVTTLAAAPGPDVARGLPVRRFGSYARMGHYPGWWWSATMGDLVGYESLLERDRLMLADFDRDVVAVASQPFGLSGRDGVVLRRHVPDYLLLRRNGSVEVVDVKPVHLVDKPEVAELLRWTGQVLGERGWRYSVWSGADALRLTNIRFLAQGRRGHMVDAEAVRHLQAHAGVGLSVGEVLEAASRSNVFPLHDLRAGVAYLLWHQLWQVCLDEPFDSTTRIDEIRKELG